MKRAFKRLTKTAKRVTTKVLNKVAGIKYVGGLAATGLLSNPIVAPHYGAITGDWKSVGRAIATSAVLAASVYAGNLAAEAYAQPILIPAQGLTYTGPSLNAVQYIGANALISFDTSFAIAKINGASTHDAWRAGLESAKGSIPFTLLDMAAINMRADQVISSRRDPRGYNATKISGGYRGDRIGIAGCRYPCTASPLGGVQGQNPGNLLGVPYASDNLGNFIAEAGAGPHDFLSQWQYDALGNTKPFFQSGAGNVLGWAGSVALLPISVPISIGSVLAPYSGILYSDRYLYYGP